MLTGTAATSVARSSKTKPAAATLKTRRVLADVSAPPDMFRLDLQDRTYWSIISKSVLSPELACQAAIHIFYSFYWSVEGKLGILNGQLSVYGICPEVAAFVNINMTYPPIHSIYNLSPPSIPKSGWFWLGQHPSLAGPTPHSIIFHWLSSGHLSLHPHWPELMKRLGGGTTKVQIIHYLAFHNIHHFPVCTATSSSLSGQSLCLTSGRTANL